VLYSVILIRIVILIAIKGDASTQTLSGRPPDPFAAATSFSEREPDAVALATALLIHDRSIHSMEWSDEVFCPAPEPFSGSWVLHRCKEGEDETGRFYQHFMNGHRDRENPQFVGYVYIRGHLLSEDGISQVGYQERDPEGEAVVVGPAGPDLSAYWSPGPPMFLGRRVALHSWKRLGDLLMEGQELRIETPENEAGVVRLRAVVFTGAYWSDILVDVDTRHGFMPVRIENRDAYTLRPLEIITTSTVSEVDGVFLPAAGQRETFTSGEVTADEVRDLTTAYTRRGIPITGARHPEDAKERSLVQAAIAEVFGAAGYPRRPAARESPQRVETVEYLSVNKSIAARVKFEIPPTWRVFNLWDFMANGRPEEDPDADDGPQERKP